MKLLLLAWALVAPVFAFAQLDFCNNQVAYQLGLQADAAMKQDRLDSAYYLYTKAINKACDDYPGLKYHAHKNLGVITRIAKKYNESLAHYQKALTYVELKDEDGAIINTAMALTYAGYIKKAEEYYLKVHNKGPLYYVNSSNFLLTKKAYDSAIYLIKPIIKQQTDNSLETLILKNNLAVAYFWTKRIDTAIQEWLRIWPNAKKEKGFNTQVSFNLARAYRAKQMYDQAAAWYDTTTQVPNCAPYYENPLNAIQALIDLQVLTDRPYVTATHMAMLANYQKTLIDKRTTDFQQQIASAQSQLAAEQLAHKNSVRLIVSYVVSAIILFMFIRYRRRVARMRKRLVYTIDQLLLINK